MTQVTTYTELIAAIELQRQALGIKMTDFDDLCVFPAGLWGKASGLLQAKRLGPEKLFDALRGAGLRLRVEIDPEQHEKMKSRIADNYNPRQANQARNGHAASLPSAAIFSRILKPVGRLGGRARWRGKSQQEKSQHMRMMAMAGVKKRRKEQARRARQRKAAHKARKQ